MSRSAALTAVLVLAAVLAGCTVTVQPQTANDTAAIESNAATGDGTLTGDSYTVTVVDVVDGDTVDVRFENGSTDTVRLLGVDTPEVHVEVQPTEYEGIPDTEAGRSCLRAAGENASDAMRSWVGDETVTLQFDPEADTRGGYGRLLGYVLVDGENVNYDLLTTGHARLYDSAFTQRDRFADAESEARAAGRGLWRCAG